MVKKYLYWFEELGQEFRDLVGNKCANIGEMAKLGLPVPKGFALSVEAYKEFMIETDSLEEIKQYLQNEEKLNSIEQFNQASKEIRSIVESKEMPESIRAEILSSYHELCQRCGIKDVAVATRSAGTISRPGQYETYLNVKGDLDLLEKIKKVWASSFNSRSLAYRSQKGLPLEIEPIGVAVLKMVNARSAGVLFTADPNSGDSSRMIVEANWGLGESVVGGEIMPDVYIFDKNNLKVVEKKLGRKTKFVTFKKVGVAEDETPAEKSSAYCLSDQELRVICELGKKLESHFGVPQDVEWAIDQDIAFPDNVILLQTRNEIVVPKKNPVDQVLDYMLDMF